MAWSDEELDNRYGPTSFERKYRCYSMTSAGKESLESGDKILMPMSALESLASLNISYPMNFKIKNHSAERVSHCGVLEFIADEGTVLVPRWMMQNLSVREGDIVVMKNVTLPKATFMKLQPHSKEFLDISDPKVTLEKALGSYSCLTKGDTIMIADNNRKYYYIDIVETKPYAAVSMFDTNCETDFLPPLDYKEPEKPAASALTGGAAVLEKSDSSKFMHMGIGRRLDGKPSTLSFSSASSGRHVCSNVAGLSPHDPLISQTYLKKAKTSHPSRGHTFGSDTLDSHKEMGSYKASVLEKSDSSKFMHMGIGRRLDGKPSALSFSSASSGRHVCSKVAGLSTHDPLISQTYLKKTKTSHPSRGHPFGSDTLASHKEMGSYKPSVLKTPNFMGMGIPKRLDGKPSELSVSSALSAPTGPRHAFRDSNGPSTSPASLKKETISHPSAWLAAGSSRQDTYEVPENPAGSPVSSNAPVHERPSSCTFMDMGTAKHLDGKPTANNQDAFKEPEKLAPSTPSNNAPVLKKSNIGASMGTCIRTPLDATPSQSYAPGDIQNGLGSASTRNLESNTSGGLPPGSIKTDTQHAHTSQQALKMNVPKFKPFTGKKYTLGGCSNA